MEKLILNSINFIKKHYSFLSLVTLISCSFIFLASCSSNDVDNTSGKDNTGNDRKKETVEKVVWVSYYDGTTNRDLFRLSYEGNRLSELVFGDDYKGGTFKLQYDKDGYDVVMTATAFSHNNLGRAQQVLKFHLNQLGYLSDGVEIVSLNNDGTPYVHEIYFTYDSDGHLTSYKNSNEDNWCKIVFTYKNGNLVESSEICSNDPTYEDEKVKIEYSSNPNSHKFMPIDCMEIADFDLLEGLALAGLLGKPSMNLPSKINDELVTWNLDEDNYPLSYVLGGDTTHIEWAGKQ